MSKPISFNGTEYASVEAMPADARAAYQAQSDADMQEPNEMLTEAGAGGIGAEPQAPAWGGARPDGSMTVWGLCLSPKRPVELGAALAVAYVINKGLIVVWKQ
jgi:hypothetical protein